MKLEIVKTQKFRKSLKRIRRQSKFNEKVFIEVLDTLAEQKQLDEKFRDHGLSGDMSSYRECHLATDILLVYCVRENKLTLALINIGSHANLFK
jgi:mRNA interferase YafQ